MKKVFLFCIAVMAMSIFAGKKADAQNVQLFYDTERECKTTTIEMFKPDSFGSTFFFADFDYSPKVSGAYWEIARELCWWQESKLSWLSVHVEYNGGMNSVAGSFNNAWLAGLTYSGHTADFSKTWSLTASYKHIPDTYGLNGNKQEANFQITGVWGISFADGWCSFSGFADFWREARPWQDTEYIFMTEPQFWVNLNKAEGWEKINLSIGGELEISSNFVEKGFKVMPAIGAKWTF